MALVKEENWGRQASLFLYSFITTEQGNQTM